MSEVETRRVRAWVREGREFRFGFEKTGVVDDAGIVHLVLTPDDAARAVAALAGESSEPAPAEGGAEP